MEKWNDVKKEIKSISTVEMKAIEIMAEMDVEYDARKIKRLTEILEDWLYEVYRDW